jgi:hypothetical protein
MGGSVRWHVRRVQNNRNGWVICNKVFPYAWENCIYINMYGKIIQKDYDDLINRKDIIFSTRKSARDALRCYRTKFFGWYAKHWDRKILRNEI